MKAVLMSIQPKWCELIASGKKTVEVRKTKPKLETPFKVYIYRTKGFMRHLLNGKWWNMPVGGNVIGEFVCEYVEEFENHWANNRLFAIAQSAKLSACEIADYLDGKEFAYGWHISGLVIYDKPKELGEFWNADKCPYASKDGCTYQYHCFRAGQAKRCGDTLTRPPQSWAYVEELEVGR